MDEMKKYIIEFSEDPHTIKLMKIKNGDKFPVTEFKTVKPYTEPDTESIRKEAYEQGYTDGRKKHEVEVHAIAYTNGKQDGYQKGFNDAWEAARKIWEYDMTTLQKIFGKAMRMDCYTKFTASEAIEKIRRYEQEQEKEKKQEKKESIIAEDIMRQYLNTFCNGRHCASCPLDTPDFTCGRGYHFTSANPISDEEVRRAYIEVRQKMEEN